MTGLSQSPPSPVVTCFPSVNKVEVEVSPHQQVFPACAVTRIQILNKNRQETKEEKRVPNVQFPLPAFPFSVSRTDLLQEQQDDPSLS